MKKWKNLLLDNWWLKLISLLIAFVLWVVVINVDDPVDDKTFSNIKVNLVNTQLITDKNMVYEVLEGTGMLRSVTFEAPKSIREKIEAGDIVAEADLEELTTTDTVPIRFSCPKYNQQVSNITGNIAYVKLNIEEKDSKWIDITYNIVGDVSEGYVINHISLDQNRMEIEGPSSKVAEVSKAVVDVNVAGISRDMSLSVDVHLKDENGKELNYSTIAKSTDRVKVNVVVYATKEVPVEFEIVGEPARGYAATGEIEMDYPTVMVTGPDALLNNISSIVIPADIVDITDISQDLEMTVNLRRYLSSGLNFADKEFDGNVQIKVDIEKLIEESLEITPRDVEIINKPTGMIVEDLEETKIPDLHIRGLEKDVSAVEVKDLNGTIDVMAWMEAQGIEVLTSGTYQLPVTFEFPDNVTQKDVVMVTLQFITAEDYASQNPSTTVAPQEEIAE